jgi:hypothetical protein
MLVVQSSVASRRASACGPRHAGARPLLPGGSCPGREPNQLAGRCRRWRRGIVKYDPLAPYLASQGGEERHILLASETHDLLCGHCREQRKVGKTHPVLSENPIRLESRLVG